MVFTEDSLKRTIVLKCHMANTKAKNTEGKRIQFLGSGYINRQKDGVSCKCSPDAAFVPDLLPDLKYKEGEIEVDCTVSLDQFEGSTQMWCFGNKLESRAITPYKPEFVRTEEDSDVYKMKGDYMYLDEWCSKVYFANIPNGRIFPVYVSVKRISETSKN